MSLSQCIYVSEQGVRCGFQHEGPTSYARCSLHWTTRIYKIPSVCVIAGCIGLNTTELANTARTVKQSIMRPGALDHRMCHRHILATIDNQSLPVSHEMPTPIRTAPSSESLRSAIAPPSEHICCKCKDEAVQFVPRRPITRSMTTQERQ